MESVLAPVPDQGNADVGDRGSRAPSRPRAKHPLPTDRLKFDKGPESLRAYSVASRNGVEPVDAAALARLINVSPATSNLNSAFFMDVGLITRQRKGQYLPTDPVNEYRRLYTFEDENAAHVLAPVFARTWFYNALVVRDEMGAMTRKVALRVLADEAGADESFMPQLELLLDWLELVGLLEVDHEDGLVFPQPVGIAVSDLSDDAAVPGRATPTKSTPSGPAAAAVSVPTTANPVHADRAAPVVLAVNFELKLTAADLAMLKPDQITAMFAAAGTLAAIKATVTEEK